MPPHCSNSNAAQALYQTFVIPSLYQKAGTASQAPAAPLACLQTSRRPRQHVSIPPRQPTQARPFASTPNRRAKTRAPELRTQKWDEEITARHIRLIDTTTNRLSSSEPRTKSDILRYLDRKTHRLVQVQPDEEAELSPDGRERIPICKIVSKKDAFDAEKRKKSAQKEAKKAAAAAASVKTLELNWAIDQNDLGHRLGKVEQFLGEGRKVEIVLAAKKAGRKATLGECEKVLQRIRKNVGAVEGGREVRAMEGRLGGVATLFFQGRVGKVQTEPDVQAQAQAQAQAQKEAD